MLPSRNTAKLMPLVGNLKAGKSLAIKLELGVVNRLDILDNSLVLKRSIDPGVLLVVVVFDSILAIYTDLGLEVFEGKVVRSAATRYWLRTRPVMPLPMDTLLHWDSLSASDIRTPCLVRWNRSSKSRP